jgi:hypothetical protein
MVTTAGARVGVDSDGGWDRRRSTMTRRRRRRQGSLGSHATAGRSGDRQFRLRLPRTSARERDRVRE